MELRSYLAVLRRRWTLIAGVLLASVLVSAGVTFLVPPTYEADTQLFVSTQTDGTNANTQLFQGGSFSVDRVKSYAQLATSPKVLEPVRQQLGLTTDPDDLAREVQASVPTDTVLLDVRVTSESAQTASDLTNALGAQLGRVIEELEAPANGSPSPVKVSILKQAVPPSGPISPSLPLNLAAGLLIGLIVGVGIVLVLDSLDVTVKGPEDLARVTELPVLARVVYDADAADTPVARGDMHDSRSEAFRQLRTNLQFAFVDEKPGVLVVTSALSGEGKSSVSGNLALSLQQLGWQVCLVDGDLRRPSVAEYFGLVGETGLTTVLIGRASAADVVQTAAPGLDVLTSGAVPPNPGELLASSRMSTVLAELSTRYDMVVVDAPPTLPVADAAALASRADGTLYVISVGSTTRAQVEQALKNLEQVRAKVLGVVLNKAPSRGGRDGYYGYDGTYRPDPSAVPVSAPGAADPSRPPVSQVSSVSQTAPHAPVQASAMPQAPMTPQPASQPSVTPAQYPVPASPSAPADGAERFRPVMGETPPPLAQRRPQAPQPLPRTDPTASSTAAEQHGGEGHPATVSATNGSASAERAVPRPGPGPSVAEDSSS